MNLKKMLGGCGFFAVMIASFIISICGILYIVEHTPAWVGRWL